MYGTKLLVYAKVPLYAKKRILEAMLRCLVGWYFIIFQMLPLLVYFSINSKAKNNFSRECTIIIERSVLAQ
jgi:hypothetical protein